MKTVLLIDNDEAHRKPVAELLRSKGWQVYEAEEGNQGLDMALRHIPQAIVFDLLMPGMNGIQFCTEIRKEDSCKNTKLLLLTGREYPAEQKIAQETGADDYLVKSLAFTKLADVLEQLTGNPVIKDALISKQASAHKEKPGYLKFWGVRGSIPTPGRQTAGIGGNTPCVEIRTDGKLIILDGGSGLRLLGNALKREFTGLPLEATILLTHTHWDHIQGLPFFVPFYEIGNRIQILGAKGASKTLPETLSDQMQSPYFPVNFHQLAAQITVEEFAEMEFKIGDIGIQAAYANHPDPCVGYRLNTSSGSICYIPDHESQPEGFLLPSNYLARTSREDIVRFVANADLLIMDSQYTREEYPSRLGWGHGCMDEVVQIAIEARVKKLFLFHHDPSHDDAFVNSMLDHARHIATGKDISIEIAREGESVVIGAPA